MDPVVGGDVRGPVLLKTRDELGGREVEVVVHHLLHLRERPVAGICPAQKGRDVVGVGAPALHRRVFLRRIALLRRVDDVHGDRDVVLQQRRQLAAGGRAVEGRDRVADIGLVLHEAPGGRVLVGQVRRRADDVEACPGDVVFPELSHPFPQVLLRRGGRLEGQEPQSEEDENENRVRASFHGNPLSSVTTSVVNRWAKTRRACDRSRARSGAAPLSIGAGAGSFGYSSPSPDCPLSG